MSVKALYTAVATAKGGRNGNVSSSDGVLNLEVRMPKELGGAGGAYTNPEQLFAAGYSACFDSALNLVIKNAKLNITDTSVRAHVSIGANETGGFGLVITLDVNIPGIEKEQAALPVENAHQVCPYSNATRGNVEVTLNATTVPAAEF